jgi:peptidoglycan/LPS O-acetylase OafA/YrhL
MTPVFILFALCIAGHARWLSMWPLVFMGTISYPLYLVHSSLIYRLQLLAFSWGISEAYSAIPVLIAVLCVAASISFGVERPANRAIRGAYKRLRTRRASRPARCHGGSG